MTSRLHLAAASALAVALVAFYAPHSARAAETAHKHAPKAATETSADTETDTETGAETETEAKPPIARTPRPAEAKLYIISPQNGDTVSSPVTVRFGLTGMEVAPAGTATPNTGHHHLIIDSPVPAFDAPLQKDDRHLHFGAGQTEANVVLTPGKHRLQLVLADKDHVPHDPPLVSEPITITVK
jgi:hypothetical protein